MVLLFNASKDLPTGTAYTVWTGIGSAGTDLTGLWVFREPVIFWHHSFLSALIGSLIGLKVVSPP